MSLSGEVDHKVGIPKHLPYKGIVCKVSFDEPVSGVSLEILNVCRVAPYQTPIDICNHEILTGLYNVMDEVAPDEAKTACHDELVQDIISAYSFRSDPVLCSAWFVGLASPS